jgi:hypothetical protein
VRRSASSIQVSSKLDVATSPTSSQGPCSSRKLTASCLLSSSNSASISNGFTKSTSLSKTRCNRLMWPIDRSVVPAKLVNPFGNRGPLLELAGLAEQDAQSALGWRPTQHLIGLIANRAGR